MRVIAFWICVCAYLNCVGWILSALHELNAAGYAVALLAGAMGAVWLRKASAPSPGRPALRRKALCQRFSKPLPFIFLAVALLEFLGGAVYAPNNYDALTYRLPRMLNWMSAGHWLWIDSFNARMNYSTAGWEWTAMPLLELLRSDRAFFLIEIAAFLSLPGLLFSIFRRLGVGRKAAWTWMWILPLGYGYATQAGSIGNDLLGACFAAAAVAFGLRARHSGRVADVWLAGLAAALMTAVKLSNLPLLLPCLVAVWPALAQLRGRWAGTAAVAAAALLASSAPTIALNQLHTGSWTGDPGNTGELKAKSLPGAMLGNVLLLVQQSFMPPVLPGAHKIDETLNHSLPGACQRLLRDKFPRYYLNRLNELPQEEAAGLGIGVTLLLLASLATAAWRFRGVVFKRLNVSSPVLVGFAAWGAMLFYMLEMGSESTARLLLPYYFLAVTPALMLPGINRLAGRRTWMRFAALAAVSVLPAIILSPSRPIFPLTAAERMFQHHAESQTAQRLAMVYSAYAHRNDSLAPLRAALPENVQKIGYVAGSNDTDYSLWRPFGTRQVVALQNVVKDDRPIPSGVEWIAVRRQAWQELTSVPLEDWAVQHRAKIVLSTSIVTIVSWGEQTWCLLHIEKP